MSKNLRIARGFGLPLDSVTKTFAILAQRRKGKTYTASVMAEEMVDAGIPWVALDPTGAWWGLRAGADGSKRGGLPVYVFGGDQGDLPLERSAGKQIADLVVENPGHYVLDFSHLDSKEAERQLATDFAERFYRRKGRAKEPMHLFVDEADLFVPQQSPSGDKRMVGAFESIVRRGGIRGIGTTLISQRAAVVNKNVLEQIDVLITLRVVGPNDRKAIKGYVDSHGDPQQQADMLDSLSGLGLGEAWIWEPGADIFERVKVRERRTFNSSATPDGRQVEVKGLAEVNLDALRGQLDQAIERAKAEDPKELRKRVSQLERELKQRPTETEVQEVEKVVEIPVLSNGATDDLRKVIDEVRNIVEDVHDNAIKVAGALQDATQPIVSELVRIGQTPNVARRQSPRQKTSPPPRPRPAASREPAADREVVGGGEDDLKLKAGARRMLEVMASHHPMRVTRAQLATLAKMKVTGGTFSTYFSTLKRHGLLSEQGGEIEITEAGFDQLGLSEPPVPQSPEEVLAMWRGSLKKGAREMLDVLVEFYDAPVSREELAERIGMEVTGGTFGTYLGTLRRNGLAEVDGDEVRASETLFLGAPA